MITISYMGTKRPIAPMVADLALGCQAGTCLDLFAGMCAVGLNLASSRQVWSNDLQGFASLVARCQFCSTDSAPDPAATEHLLTSSFHQHLKRLETTLIKGLIRESSLLDNLDYTSLADDFETSIFVANRIQNGSGTRYSLFVERYGSTYFSLKQCAEIDSLRYAIDTAVSEEGIQEWCLIALCAAMSRCTTTTGHFAQPLAPKSSNIVKFAKQRRRSIWQEFIWTLISLEAIGSPDWRSNNKVFQTDALRLLQQENTLEGISLVYADPPYTSDQYSRYYHLYETAIYYDYPAARSRGLYRDNRATSTFSHAAKVASSIDRLVAGVAAIGADLILSYPTKGLLFDSQQQINGIIKRHFGRSPDVTPFSHSHSTMGASKGAATSQVVELLYRARSGNVAT